ncbi:Riboflavin synthase-like beta-barrel [Penicillium macrosclerotiorum]|uniref:Riboflavin synthase-like beta-barrel n=1 Tax=Penicillium macrosclerotiorum TaxID=303699 RepID=UPI002546D8D1|nr:Riboflavin synthase-like beta-barrel [Penicillium macrosclerotiorum]KAJ5683475.1 Riboflavin synthase-like beta-barrel [Penicillium macrosclerotiorum]
MGVQLAGNGPGEPPMNPFVAVPLFAVGGFVAILFLWRTTIRIQHSRRFKLAQQVDDQTQLSQANSTSAKLKRHLLYAPLWGTRHSREFRLLRLHMGSIPLRLEVIFLVIYLLMNFIFVVVTVDWWEDYSKKLFQLKYAAGHLAVMNTPGLVLSAGRNNPLVPLLGLSFDTFNFMHRWVGRVIAANAVIHMSSVLANQAYLNGSEYIMYRIWQMPFYIYGLVAILGFIFIVIQSLSPVRHSLYELFLHLHIALAVMSFVALWYHLKNLLQQRVLLGTLILWGLDRAGRLAILIWRNCGKRRTMATVEALPGSVARVDIEVSRAWKFKPGQYMYLYMPCLGLWTSHPFTVAWTSSGTESLNLTEKNSSSDSFASLIGGSETTTMSVLIKGQDGFTKKLLKKVEDSPEGTIKATALAEGPFGGIHTLASYGTLLLVAGGIGITHPMSYLHEVVTNFASRKSATRKVHLVWMIRNLDHLAWIHNWMTEIFGHSSLNHSINEKGETFSQCLNLSLSISIHVTGLKDDVEEYLPTPETPWTDYAPSNVPVSIHHEKPCFRSLLETEKSEQVGALAVSVCGPGGLGDSVRDAVRHVQGEKTVDLFEETFSW